MEIESNAWSIRLFVLQYQTFAVLVRQGGLSPSLQSMQL
jgi:hypothetical protein